MADMRLPLSINNHRLNRLILSVGIGNIMECYDFAVFGGLIDAIAFNFFPTNNGNDDQSFMYALIIFSAAFITRPLGGAVLGYIGDFYGRKIALIISMILMLVPSFLIGCLPTYSQAGYFSTVMLIICRLAQGN
jgi:MFS transporter, MHS family, proline/betaine transporter